MRDHNIYLWLVVLGSDSFETVFQSISGQYFSQYRAISRQRRERIEESKNAQTRPLAPTASSIGPCPTIIQIVGHPGTGSLLRTITPPDHPLISSPGRSPGRGIVLPPALASALAKCLSFYVKVFYVMDKVLSGELSCPFDRSCIYGAIHEKLSMNFSVLLHKTLA